MKFSIKIVLATFLVVLACITVVLQQATSEDAVSTLALESTNVDYHLGIVKANTVVKATVFITNKLNEALDIKETRSACECLTLKVLPQRVERNGIFQVDVTIDTSGFKPNEKTEEVGYILTKNSLYEIIRFAVQINTME